jgi:hypothetical protein
MTRSPRLTAGLCAVLWLGIARTSAAHDGPPFPIVSDRAVGPYTISVWTDPDTTDDETPGGQFWVMLGQQDADAPVPAGTRATITTHPLDRPGTPQSAATEPVRGDPATQFAAVVFDHEGRFAVQVEVNGPLGRGAVDSAVAATYDLRPPPLLVVLYMMPFIVVGVIWTKLLLRRRAASPPRPESGSGGSAPTLRR